MKRAGRGGKAREGRQCAVITAVIIIRISTKNGNGRKIIYNCITYSMLSVAYPLCHIWIAHLDILDTTILY